jgi:predicted nucleotidyltransferase
MSIDEYRLIESMIEVIMPIDQKLINEIVNRIRAVVQAERVILFGSAASGEMTRNSDIDLLVLDSSLGNTRQKSVSLSRALRGMGYPFDIIVMDTERFDESKDVIGGIAYPANKYGKVIYAAG